MYNIYRNLCAKLSDSSSYKSLYLCVHIEGLISIDSATDPDQQYTYIYMHFVGSAMPPSACIYFCS